MIAYTFSAVRVIKEQMEVPVLCYCDRYGKF